MTDLTKPVTSSLLQRTRDLAVLSEDDLRRFAAEAAREAAARLIRDRVDATADEALVGDAIRSIGSR